MVDIEGIDLVLVVADRVRRCFLDHGFRLDHDFHLDHGFLVHIRFLDNDHDHSRWHILVFDFDHADHDRVRDGAHDYSVGNLHAVVGVHTAAVVDHVVEVVRAVVVVREAEVDIHKVVLDVQALVVDHTRFHNHYSLQTQH